MKNKTAKFIERARLVYGNRYGYDRTDYLNLRAKVIITCYEHGDFKQAPRNHLNKMEGCKTCSDVIRKTAIRATKQQQAIDDRIERKKSFLEKASKKYNGKYDYSASNYIDMKTPIDIGCPEHGMFNQLPINHLHHIGCNGCRPVNLSQIPFTTQEFIERARLVHGDIYDYTETVYLGSRNNVTVYCKEHASYFDIEAAGHLQGHGCQRCSLSAQTSIGEREIADFLSSIGINFITNDRSIIGPKEIDIYVPSAKIAIEYCGLYWHSEIKGKTKRYHLDKHVACAKKGIQLITIFEDEWRDRNLQVKEKLSHMLGVSDKTSVYARKCKILEVSKKDKSIFFDVNHIQGDGPSSINYGLYYNNELVACMAFNKISGVHYLNRYATAYRVIGGAGKLMQFFKNNNEWKKLVSFADCRWSDGNLYTKTGWELDATLDPDYSYFYKNTRMHKFNFRHNRLSKILGDSYDNSKTEYENTFNNKIYRIWDCGKMRYVIHNETSNTEKVSLAERKPKVSRREISLAIPSMLLENNGIQLLEDYTVSGNQHDMLCVKCNHKWRATPKSKIQAFKETGFSGCPNCNIINRQNQTLIKLAKYLSGKNMSILGVIGYYQSKTTRRLQVRVINNECGHVFEGCANNFTQRDVTCPECNKIDKREKFIKYQEERSSVFQETASEWQVYKNKVYAATAITYDQYATKINPDNLVRGIAGIDGAYQLDHIKSVRYCFDNNISIDECSAADNLQMLSWQDNLKKGQ